MQDFAITEESRAISCIFASSLANVDRTVEIIKKFIADRQINCNIFEFIYILREALNNAVLHGNRQDPALQVQCSVSFNNEEIAVTVSDQGTGFDWRAQLRKQKVAENALSGRGIHSMGNYGFTIRYNDSGNTLYLTKKII
ncbi:MAG: ATP-binding protein [Thermodesulfobacteriota bacterium]